MNTLILLAGLSIGQYQPAPQPCCLGLLRGRFRERERISFGGGGGGGFQFGGGGGFFGPGGNFGGGGVGFGGGGFQFGGGGGFEFGGGFNGGGFAPLPAPAPSPELFGGGNFGLNLGIQQAPNILPIGVPIGGFNPGGFQGFGGFNGFNGGGFNFGGQQIIQLPAPPIILQNRTPDIISPLSFGPQIFSPGGFGPQVFGQGLLQGQGFQLGPPQGFQFGPQPQGFQMMAPGSFGQPSYTQPVQRGYCPNCPQQSMQSMRGGSLQVMGTRPPAGYMNLTRWHGAR